MMKLVTRITKHMHKESDKIFDSDFAPANEVVLPLKEKFKATTFWVIMDQLLSAFEH